MSVLQVRFVAAESTVWEGEASMVTVTTVDGSMGILPRMTPVLAVLAEGPVTITDQQGEKKHVRVSGGFVSVDESVVTVVADDILESDIAA